MSDLLQMDYINSLPQPFMVTFVGGDSWPVYDICVETGLIRIDVCGLHEIKDIGEVKFFTDADGDNHKAETFYCEYHEATNDQ